MRKTGSMMVSPTERVLLASLRWGKACDELAMVKRARFVCRIRDREDGTPPCSVWSAEMFQERGIPEEDRENCESCFAIHGNRHLNAADVLEIRRQRRLAVDYLRRAVKRAEKELNRKDSHV
jgi:hypothetical protein